MENLFEWKEEFATGFKEIDAQHHKVFDIINRLNSALREQHGKDVIWDTLDELVQYADYHFKYEESLFAKYNFAGSPEHIAEHNDYCEKVSHFILESKESNTLPYRVLDFLVGWWRGHITGSDREYIKCFKEHGLE
jgi:hemerythrin